MYQKNFTALKVKEPNADIVYETVMETMQQMAPKAALVTPEAKPTQVRKAAVGLGARTVVAAMLWIMGATPAIGHMTAHTVSAKMAMAAVTATSAELRAQDAKTNFETAAKQLADAAQALDIALNQTATSIRPNGDINPVVASHMAIAITRSEAFKSIYDSCGDRLVQHARQALLDFKAAQGNLDQAIKALKDAQDRLPKDSALYAEIAQTIKDKNKEIAIPEGSLYRYEVAPGVRTDIFHPSGVHLYELMSSSGKILFEDSEPTGKTNWAFDLKQAKLTRQPLTASVQVLLSDRSLSFTAWWLQAGSSQRTVSGEHAASRTKREACY